MEPGWAEEQELPANWGILPVLPGHLGHIVRPWNAEPPWHVWQEGWHRVCCHGHLLLTLSCSQEVSAGFPAHLVVVVSCHEVLPSSYTNAS